MQKALGVCTVLSHELEGLEVYIYIFIIYRQGLS